MNTKEKKFIMTLLFIFFVVILEHFCRILLLSINDAEQKKISLK